MNIKVRLILMNFMQYFVWGSWLLTIGHYWFDNKLGTATQFSAIFSTMGIASLFMPALSGIIADRFINAEKLYSIFHFMGAIILFFVPLVDSPQLMFWVMLINMIFYMPTLSLSISVSFSAMNKAGLDVVRELRVHLHCSVTLFVLVGGGRFAAIERWRDGVLVVLNADPVGSQIDRWFGVDVGVVGQPL